MQIYCLDNITAESWFAAEKTPQERIRRHTQFHNYLLHELMPMSLRKNKNNFRITAGAGFGAYYALNFAIRHPHQVGRTIGMSGFYDISRWANGEQSEQLYENNPCWFIPQEHDPNRITALQHMDIVLTVGEDDPACAHNGQLSNLLWQKQIGNALRIWDGQANDWSSWQKMIHHYISGHD